MRVSHAIVGGAAALVLMGGLSVGPVAAQTAPPAVSAQDERLLSLLPPGLQGIGSEVLLAPTAVAQEAELPKLVERAQGAVVGATFSREISMFRKIMPTAYFLVPGYGAQGATTKDIEYCFNPDGLGAIINASRCILYAYTVSPWKEKYGGSSWKNATEEAIVKMNKEIRNVLE